MVKRRGQQQGYPAQQSRGPGEPVLATEGPWVRSGRPSGGMWAGVWGCDEVEQLGLGVGPAP